MKKLFTAITTVSALALLTVWALAGPPQTYDIEVVGQDNPVVDISNVQLAVDNYGTVLLVGTFDFGSYGSVEIDDDVEILGQTDNQGNPMTTISGGYETFFCDNPNVSLKISNLHFDGAKSDAIWVRQCAKAEITHNKFENLKGGPIEAEWLGPPNHGSIVTGNLAVSIRIGGEMTAHLNYDISKDIYCGKVKISYNDIDAGVADPSGTNSVGVFIMHCHGLSADVSRNTIKNYNRCGISAFDLYGSANIKWNNIQSSVYTTFPLRYGSRSNWGIAFGAGYWNIDAINGLYHVMHNTITTKANDEGRAGAIAILGSTNHAVVSQNTVDLHPGSFFGIFLFHYPGLPYCYGNPSVRGHRNLVAKNTIKGATIGSSHLNTAISLFNHDDNVLVQNDLSGWTGLRQPTVLSFSNNNTIVGIPSDEVLQINCSGNKIVGVPAHESTEAVDENDLF